MNMSYTIPGIKRVLLSGGSGMLGTALGRTLAEAGCEVVRLVRRAPSSGIEIAWNPASPRPFASLDVLDGFDAAIHLSGANLAERRWTESVKRELVASRVDSTVALAAALARLRHPPRVLLAASAVGIYGDRGGEVLDESFPSGYGFLANLCRLWEAAAQPAVEAGIRVVHLRSGVVLEPSAGALARMIPLFRLGIGGRLGSGRQWMSWISLQDWVAAVMFLLSRSEITGAVNLVTPHPVTNAEFTHALGRALHRPAFFPVPTFALRAALGEMASEMLIAGQRVSPRKLLEAGFRFEQPNIEEVLKAALS